MRGQWAGEGYLAASLILFTGIAFIFLANVNKFQNHFTRLVIGGAAVVFVFIMKFAVETAFSFKGFEPAGFFPPDFYERYQGAY